MSAAPEQSSPDESPLETPAELRAEIEQTREELAQTTQALSDKFDLKHRARSAVGSVKQSVMWSTNADRWERDPVPVVVGAATFVAGLLVLRWRERR